MLALQHVCEAEFLDCDRLRQSELPRAGKGVVRTRRGEKRSRNGMEGTHQSTTLKRSSVSLAPGMTGGSSKNLDCVKAPTFFTASMLVPPHTCKDRSLLGRHGIRSELAIHPAFSSSSRKPDSEK